MTEDALLISTANAGSAYVVSTLTPNQPRSIDARQAAVADKLEMWT